MISVINWHTESVGKTTGVSGNPLISCRDVDLRPSVRVLNVLLVNVTNPTRGLADHFNSICRSETM